MKVKPEKNFTKKKSRPFLILPLLDNVSLISVEEEPSMPKNTGLKLFTKTWPPKRDNKKTNDDKDRPLTATLEKPTILDINFIGKIDMSTVKKEFLNISNLCRMPLILKTRKTKTAIVRPLSLPPSEKRKKKKRNENNDDSLEDDESISIKSARKSKVPRPNNRLKQLESLCKKNIIKISVSDANNNKTNKSNDIKVSDSKITDNKSTDSKSAEIKTLKIPRKPTVGNKVLNLKNDLSTKSIKQLPEPCTTCGRADQPERFHSHPVTPLKPAKKMEEAPKIPVKSSVQKPIAMKYKSKLNSEKKPLPTARKPSLPSQKLLHTPPNTASKTSSIVTKQAEEKPRIKSAKRLLTCYICGREFGTASLPLHEPKCLEKWERENSKLPLNLRRKLPQKPDSALSQEDFNKLAWESSQAVLTPCINCGRTFFPDRLQVHQRSCKTPQPNRKIIEQAPATLPASSAPSTPAQPPSVTCYICGRMFGNHSIKIHEKNCLKKWSTENDALPPDMKSPLPIKGDPKTVVEPTKSPVDVKEEQQRTPSGRRPPLFPCYLCGKLFSVNSIYIHEPQCLKMWKIENDKLPAHKRRPQPLKPDIKFTHDGKLDYEATNAANWQSHLSQLVPCKICSRTFNPDRVDIHERNCKG